MPDETAPLLADADNVPNLARANGHSDADATVERARRRANVRAIVYSALTAIFVIALVTIIFAWDKVSNRVGDLPSDPDEAALVIMDASPVIVSFLMKRV